MDEVVSVDADAYALGYGKHAFRLASGTGGCWFNPNGSTPGPHMLCNLRLSDKTPIIDPTTGVREPANAVAIESGRVRKAVNVAGGGTAGPVLPAGATLAIDGFECTVAVSSDVLACRGPGGSFRYDGTTGDVEITEAPRAEPSATGAGPRTAGVGERCGEVVGNAPLPVVVLTGEVDCAVAVAVADRYVNDPTVVAQGQGRFATVDGWRCKWPYVPGRSHAESYLQCDDDPVNPRSSFRIGD